VIVRLRRLRRKYYVMRASARERASFIDALRSSPGVDPAAFQSVQSARGQAAALLGSVDDDDDDDDDGMQGDDLVLFDSSRRGEASPSVSSMQRPTVWTAMVCTARRLVGLDADS
jgi:hypothetical protein